MIPIISKIITGILMGKNSQAGNMAKLAIGLTGNSARGLPKPETIGG